MLKNILLLIEISKNFSDKTQEEFHKVDQIQFFAKLNGETVDTLKNNSLKEDILKLKEYAFEHKSDLKIIYFDSETINFKVDGSYTSDSIGTNIVEEFLYH